MKAQAPEPTNLGMTGNYHYYVQAGDVYRRQSSNARPAYYCRLRNRAASAAGQAIAEQRSGAQDVELQ
jgi:hypothetical protein